MNNLRKEYLDRLYLRACEDLRLNHRPDKPAIDWDREIKEALATAFAQGRDRDAAVINHLANADKELVAVLRECRNIGAPVAYDNNLRDKVDLLLAKSREAP